MRSLPVPGQYCQGITARVPGGAGQVFCAWPEGRLAPRGGKYLQLVAVEVADFFKLCSDGRVLPAQQGGLRDFLGLRQPFSSGEIIPTPREWEEQDAAYGCARA